MYFLKFDDQSNTKIMSQQATSETWAKSKIWLHHQRLCQFSKHHRASYPISHKKSISPFDLIHSDVWGPVIDSISGAKWFVTFIDDCTRVTWTYLMKNKSEVFQIC